jgi:hypothetical protein
MYNPCKIREKNIKKTQKTLDNAKFISHYLELSYYFIFFCFSMANKTFNKTDVIDAVYKTVKGEVSKEKISLVVNTFFETIAGLLSSSNNSDVIKVVITGYITLVSQYMEREAFKQKFKTRVVRVKVGQTVKDTVNSTGKKAVAKVAAKPAAKPVAKVAAKPVVKKK